MTRTQPDRAELAGEVTVAARALLGCVLWRGEVAVRITEVEAYDGPTDPAAHTYNGKTDRNGVMFGPAGHLYVYFSYGLHHAANVSAGPDGRGSGVLLRSGEVIAGGDRARQRRGPRVTDRDLARGPGRLTQALGITRADNGTDVLAAEGPRREVRRPEVLASDGQGLAEPVRLMGPTGPVGEISTGPRVGISKEMDRPWRFWITGDRYVSAYRRAGVP